MNRIRQLFFAMIALTGLILWAPALNAQAPGGLTGTVDRTSLTTDDTLEFTLTYTSPDGNAPKLALPTLDGFDVAGTSTSSRMSIINGATSAQMVYSYQLQPTRTGTLRIPSLHLDYNGQQLATDPITITVTQGNGTPTSNPAPQPNAPTNGNVNRKGDKYLYVEAAVDKKAPFVGEQVIFTLRIYSAATLLGQPDYQAPKFNGFWHSPEPATREYSSMGADGTMYDVTELTTMLYPTAAGTVTIDPATLTVPGGIFSPSVDLASDPITLNVKPLPSNAPADFTGAVGQFKLTATPDRTQTRVGEPVTLHIELSGTGNWGTLGDPKWPSDASWRAFNNSSNTQSNVVGGKTTGTRTYERLMVPTVEGKLTLPVISYSYFDPEKGAFQTAKTSAIQIAVAAGDPNTAASLPQDNTPADAAANAQKASGLQEIKPAPVQLTTEATPLTEQPLFVLLMLIPLGVVAGDLAWSWRKGYLTANAAQIRRSRALKRALGELRRLKKDGANIRLQVAAIVLKYLEDKIQLPLTGLPHSAVAQLLQARGISPELNEKVIATLFVGESSEFGQSAVNTNEGVIQTATRLLEDLEKEFESHYQNEITGSK